MESHDVSDHYLIYCRLKLSPKRNDPIFKTYRDYGGIQYDTFYDHLRSIPWRNIYDIPDPNKKVKFICDNIMALLNVHAPLRTRKITKQRSPWLTGGIKVMMDQRDRALCRFKRPKTREDWNNYKSLRNITNSTVVREKKLL